MHVWPWHQSSCLEVICFVACLHGSSCVQLCYISGSSNSGCGHLWHCIARMWCLAAGMQCLAAGMQCLAAGMQCLAAGHYKFVVLQSCHSFCKLQTGAVFLSRCIFCPTLILKFGFPFPPCFMTSVITLQLLVLLCNLWYSLSCLGMFVMLNNNDFINTIYTTARQIQL